jgi:hypothetical protein
MCFGYSPEYKFWTVCNRPFSIILSRVRGSVPNNNGFWIGLLDLLTHFWPYLLITINYNNPQSLYCRELAPFSSPVSILLLLLNSNTELTQRSHVSSHYDFGKDWIEINTSNSSSIILCLFFDTEACVNFVVTLRFPQAYLLLRRRV